MSKYFFVGGTFRVSEYKATERSLSMWLTFYAYMHLYFETQFRIASLSPIDAFMHIDDVHHIATMTMILLGNFYILSLSHMSVKCISDPDQMHVYFMFLHVPSGRYFLSGEE